MRQTPPKYALNYLGFLLTRPSPHPKYSSQSIHRENGRVNRSRNQPIHIARKQRRQPQIGQSQQLHQQPF